MRTCMTLRQSEHLAQGDGAATLMSTLDVVLHPVWFLRICQPQVSVQALTW